MRENIYEGSKNLVEQLKIKDGYSIIPLNGGRNNRVYLVQTESEKYILKSYFWNEKDKRDRLGTEFSFIQYAWNKGIDSIPKPLFQDKVKRMALYTYINGNKITKDEINQETIEQTLNFLIKINKNKNLKESFHLPNASESCFSIEEHISNVENRINNLKSIQVNDEKDKEALKLVENKVLNIWMGVKNNILSTCKKEEISVSDVIPLEDKILSPSDFGYHNAIRDKNGKYYFFDFEYAGWDDPAKTVGDFFNQIEIPAPISYFDLFSNTIAEFSSNRRQMQRRIHLLFPLYSVKWVCIVLNYFINVNRMRREFSEIEDTKIIQLEKAKEILKNKLKDF